MSRHSHTNTIKKRYVAATLICLLALGSMGFSLACTNRQRDFLSGLEKKVTAATLGSKAVDSTSHLLYILSRPAEGGSTVPAGSQGHFKHTAKINVRATANSGFIFVGWSWRFESGQEAVLFSAANPLKNFRIPSPAGHSGAFYLYAEFGHKIVATAGPGGSISPAGVVTVRHGDSRTFTVTPNQGYRVDQVLVGGEPVALGPGNTYTFTNVTSDHTIAATFVPVSYVISVSASPEAGGSVSGGGTYDHGSAVTVAATPAAGYSFVNWTEGETVVSTANPYTFTATADRILVANFSLNTYALTAEADPVTGGTVSGGGSYAPGTEIGLTATPAAGYSFVNWTEGETVVSTQASFTYTMPARDVTLTAHFAPAQVPTYTIKAWVYGGNGSISPSGDVKVVQGTSQTFTFMPNESYGVKAVTVDGKTHLGPMTSYTFKNVTADHTIAVSFQPSFARGLVTVTLDDGKLSQYTNAKGVLDALGIKATLFPIPMYSSNTARYTGYMSVAQLQEFKAAGHEIGSHTYNHVSLVGLDETTARNELGSSKAWLENNGLGPVTSFAAPFGAYNDATIALVKEYYSSQRITDGGFNLKATFNRYKILVKKVTNATTVAELRGWLDYVKASGSWLVLMYHNIEAGSGDLYVTPADFAAQMQAIVDSGVPAKTVQGALAELVP